MSALTLVIAGTFPYGSAELKRNSKKYLQRAVIIAVVLHCAVIGGLKLGGIIAASRTSKEPIHISRVKILPMPPPLDPTRAQPPVVQVAPQALPPAVGDIVPVPNAEAPKEQAVATQEELRVFDPAAEGLGGSGDIVIAAPEEAAELTPGEFVFYEEEAALISMPQPKYPDIARDAQIEGVVVVWARVGKDGEVREAKIQKSVAMLDDSALEAVRHSKWKPAINNKKPTEQWVAVPVRYTLH